MRRGSAPISSSSLMFFGIVAVLLGLGVILMVVHDDRACTKLGGVAVRSIWGSYVCVKELR